jgi:hypothetical protein
MPGASPSDLDFILLEQLQEHFRVSLNAISKNIYEPSLVYSPRVSPNDLDCCLQEHLQQFNTGSTPTLPGKVISLLTSGLASMVY